MAILFDKNLDNLPIVCTKVPVLETPPRVICIKDPVLETIKKENTSYYIAITTHYLLIN